MISGVSVLTASRIASGSAAGNQASGRDCDAWTCVFTSGVAQAIVTSASIVASAVTPGDRSSRVRNRAMSALSHEKPEKR